MSNSYLRRSSLLSIAIVIVFLDQISKYVSLAYLSPGISKIFIPYLINLRLVKNTGAAFSLFNDSTSTLAVLSLIVTIFLLTWVWRNSPFPFLEGLSISFLLAGSLGNGLDRWLLGYVIDFLELVPITFPIFNLADISINMALICFVIQNLKEKRKSTHP